MASFKTIHEMEKSAADDPHSMSVKLIRDELLTVERCLRGKQYYYEYKWGKNKVPRDVAVNVLASA